jgi:hypothetical protein
VALALRSQARSQKPVVRVLATLEAMARQRMVNVAALRTNNARQQMEAS